MCSEPLRPLAESSNDANRSLEQSLSVPERRNDTKTVSRFGDVFSIFNVVSDASFSREEAW
jgi:hypothetical protein